MIYTNWENASGTDIHSHKHSDIFLHVFNGTLSEGRGGQKHFKGRINIHFHGSLIIWSFAKTQLHFYSSTWTNFNAHKLPETHTQFHRHTHPEFNEHRTSVQWGMTIFIQLYVYTFSATLLYSCRDAATRYLVIVVLCASLIQDLQAPLLVSSPAVSDS